VALIHNPNFSRCSLHVFGLIRNIGRRVICIGRKIINMYFKCSTINDVRETRRIKVRDGRKAVRPGSINGGAATQSSELGRFCPVSSLHTIGLTRPLSIHIEILLGGRRIFCIISTGPKSAQHLQCVSSRTRSSTMARGPSLCAQKSLKIW